MEINQGSCEEPSEVHFVTLDVPGLWRGEQICRQCLHPCKGSGEEEEEDDETASSSCSPWGAMFASCII